METSYSHDSITWLLQICQLPVLDPKPHSVHHKGAVGLMSTVNPPSCLRTPWSATILWQAVEFKQCSFGTWDPKGGEGICTSSSSNGLNQAGWNCALCSLHHTVSSIITPGIVFQSGCPVWAFANCTLNFLFLVDRGAKLCSATIARLLRGSVCCAFRDVLLYPWL